jgi:hypothetical protein
LRPRRLILLRPLSRGALRGLAASATTSTTPSAPPAPCSIAASGWLRLLWLRRRFGSLPTGRLGTLRTTIAISVTSAAQPLLHPLATPLPALTVCRLARAFRSATLFLAADAEPLLVLLYLPLHELARLRVLLRAQLVMPAVGAASPPVGIGFLAVGAENAFRQRHR